MIRNLKLLALFCVLALAAACTDPAAGISGDEASASADGDECIAGGYLGSGNPVPCKP